VLTLVATHRPCPLVVNKTIGELFRKY